MGKTPTQLGPLERANLLFYLRTETDAVSETSCVPWNTGRWIKSRNAEIPCPDFSVAEICTVWNIKCSPSLAWPSSDPSLKGTFASSRPLHSYPNQPRPVQVSAFETSNISCDFLKVCDWLSFYCNNNRKFGGGNWSSTFLWWHWPHRKQTHRQQGRYHKHHKPKRN
jgi:hypothetical protein